MIRDGKNIVLKALILAGLILVLSCDKQTLSEPGFLEGKISIGPICPVEQDPPDPGCLPTAETYKAYPVSIWTSNGSRKIIQLNPSLDGSYKTELEPGMYQVILESGGNGPGHSNLPAKVSVISKTATIFNIDIDTGIR